MRKASALVLGSTLLFFMIGMVANWLSPTPPELMAPSTPEALGVPAVILISVFYFYFLGGKIILKSKDIEKI